MVSDSEDPFNFTQLFRQLWPLLLSLLDDALIIGLSKLGCNLPWLHWLSPVVISCTVLYLVVQFCRSSHAQKLVQMWQEFKQAAKAEIVEI